MTEMSLHQQEQARKEAKAIVAVLLMCAIAVVGFGFFDNKSATALPFAAFIAVVAIIFGVAIRNANT